MKRYFICHVVGSGTITDPYRSQVARDFPASQAGVVQSIPSNPDGSPKYRFCLCLVAANSAWPSILLISNSYAFPDYPLDGLLSAMDPVTRQTMDQSAAAFDLTGQGLHLSMTADQDANSYRTLIVAISQQFEPNFNVDSFTTAEPPS